MTLADRKEKTRSLVRAVDAWLARASADNPNSPLRRDILRCLAGLYRGNILARTGLTAIEEDLAVAVVINTAATVEEYRYEDCYFRVVEPDQVIAEHLDTASHSLPVVD